MINRRLFHNHYINRFCFIVFLFFALASPWALRAEVSNSEVRDFINATYRIADGVNQLTIDDPSFDRILLRNSTISGLNWLQLFGYIAAANEVARAVENKEYAKAASQVAVGLLAESTRNSSITLAFSGATSIARLASFAIDIGLRRAVAQASEAALQFQLNQYFRARDFGLSHQCIITATCNDVIWNRNWIYRIADGEGTALVLTPPNYTAEQVYNLGQRLYEVNRIRQSYANDSQPFIEDFREVLTSEGILRSVGCTALLNSSNSIPDGYGASFNLFSSNRESFFQGYCENTFSITDLSIGSGDGVHLIYPQAYLWNGQAWMQITLQGDTRRNGWFVGQAGRKNTLLPFSGTGRTNWVAAYVCTNVQNEWKCGCRDSNCRQSRWQVQGFQFR